MSTLILGIESSCDETAAAVLQVRQDDLDLRANIVSSQVKLHTRYGGVVPELASRAHMQNAIPVIHEALAQAEVKGTDLDAIAVTQGPGLIGALLVGLQVAKSLSYVWRCPLVGVNHLDGHLKAVYLEDQAPPPFPFLALLISGGHTSLYRVNAHHEIQMLGATRDDAAGEAFDKAAKMLGLPYPGGVHIDRLAKDGDPERFAFPRAMLHKGLDFSFSGLKTACRNTIAQFDAPPQDQDLADICASYQEAIVDVLWKKTLRALKQEQCTHLVVTGGVAANSRIRDVFHTRAKPLDIHTYFPSRTFCTDNAAMIAAAGYFRLQQGPQHDLSLNAHSRMPLNPNTPTKRARRHR